MACNDSSLIGITTSREFIDGNLKSGTMYFYLYLRSQFPLKLILKDQKILPNFGFPKRLKGFKGKTLSFWKENQFKEGFSLRENQIYFFPKRETREFRRLKGELIG